MKKAIVQKAAENNENHDHLPFLEVGDKISIKQWNNDGGSTLKIK